MRLFQTVITTITLFSSPLLLRRSLEFHQIEFRNARMKCFVSALARARESEIGIEKRFRIHFYLFATRDLKLMLNSAFERSHGQKEKQRFRSMKTYSNFEWPELRQRRMKLLSPLRGAQQRDEKRKANTKRSARTLAAAFSSRFFSTRNHFVFVSVLLLSSHQPLPFLRNRPVGGARIAVSAIAQHIRDQFHFLFVSHNRGNFSTFLLFFGSCRGAHVTW